MVGPVHSSRDFGLERWRLSKRLKSAKFGLVAGKSWAAWRSNRRQVSYTLAKSLPGVVA